MKKLLLLVVSLIAAVSLSYAQYHYDASFPVKGQVDTILVGATMHGVAVDPAGNLWVGGYTPIKGDSLFDPSPAYNKVRALVALHCFKPDGSEASFSPIKILGNDTLWSINSNRGMQMAPDGNILFSWFNIVFLVDYHNGKLLTRIAPSLKANTAATADVNGNIFTAHVTALEGPLEMWDKLGAKQVDVVAATPFYSRTIVCNRAGDKVYYAGYTGHSVIVYKGDALFGFVQDTVILKGFDCESMCRSGNTDTLWASAGSGNDKPNQYPDVTTGYSSHTWYKYDPATDKISDSIKWNGLETWSADDLVNVRPRGVATSITGDTVFVAMFGSRAGMSGVQRWIKGPTAVRQEPGVVATSYELGQNYPNPFNPSTKINFSLPSASTISLKVFDVLGKEVATLAEGHYAAGSYTATFDAKNLNSGVFFYTLRTSTGFTQSGKMMLMK